MAYAIEFIILKKKVKFLIISLTVYWVYRL